MGKPVKTRETAVPETFSGALRPEFPPLKAHDSVPPLSVRAEPSGRYVRRMSVGLALAALSVLLIFIAQRAPTSFFEGYAVFSRTVSSYSAALFQFIPFSAAEFAVYALAFCPVVIPVRGILRIIRRYPLRAEILGMCSWFTLLAGIIAFWFTSFWGLSYFAPPLADTLGYSAAPESEELLFQTAYWLADEANAHSLAVPRGEDGVTDLGPFHRLAAQTTDGFDMLSASYPMFGYICPPPKRLTLWPVFSYSGVAGVYSPFTGEANVNPDIPSFDLPFTMSHEVAHRMGASAENEANFIAFLACRESTYPGYRYSGYLNALTYCLNACAGLDSERYAELWNYLAPGVTADLKSKNRHYTEYDGPVREAASKVTDTYLRAMSVEDGIKSYGRVADLLIADYLKRQGG